MKVHWLVTLLTLCLMAGGCGKKEESLMMPESANDQSASEPADDDASPAAATQSSSADAGEKVNINTADAATLASVPGIGEKMADDIIAYREEHGKFSSTDQLKGNIKGVGEKKFDKMKDHITVDGGMSHGTAPDGKSGGGHHGKHGKTKAPAGKVNLNTATAEELDAVPGIGPKMAEAIVAYRKEHGKFSSADQLKGNIKGVGEKTFEKMKDHLTVE